MKRMIIGSFLLGILTVFGFFSIGEYPVYVTIVYFVYWYGLLGYMIYSGYKAQKKSKQNTNTGVNIGS